MRTVSFLGAGNVAFHLVRAFVQNTFHVKQIYNRTPQKAEDIAEANKIRFTHKISELERADLFIIAASDSAIEELSLHIPYDDVMVVHTSGSIPMDALKGNYRKGVLYPLQTFSKGKSLDYNEVPFFLEAEHEQDALQLKEMVERISNKVDIINSDQRRTMHMAAVWSCNFVNHMYYIAQELAASSDLPFDYLRPLIEETARKIETLTPYEAQTGPAKREDEVVLEKHYALLEQHPRWQQLYKSITQSIQNTYNNEL